MRPMQDSRNAHRQRDWLSIGVGAFTAISAISLLAFGAYKPPPGGWWPYFVIANLLAVLGLGIVLMIWGYRGDVADQDEDRGAGD